jgi:type IX secretion system PorP/SprF family membrane protein
VKKLCIVVLCCTLVFVTSKAQFVSQYSQYMFAKGSFNPAAIAEGDMMQFTGLHRQQWVGMSGAPVDTYVSLTTPFTYKKKQFGAGLAFNNESLGLFTKQYVALQGAYKRKLGDGILSLGANIGAISIGFKGDSVYIPTGDDYHVAAGTDDEIPTSQVSGMAFDLSLGAYYSTEDWYAGISVLDINQPTIHWSDSQETYVGSMLFLTGGYNLPLSNTNFTLKPSFLLKTNFVSYQTDVDLLAEYKNKWWGGLAYRFRESVIFMGGIRLAMGLNIGYSFDLPVTNLISTTYGSHEVFLTYDFKILFEKKKNRYKSVRIL